MSHTHDRSGVFWRYTLLIAILLAILLASVASWNRKPWSDEGWFSSAAYNLAHRGFMGTTVIDPVSRSLTRIDQRTYWTMPLFLVGQALWYKIFPATLFWTRAFTIFWAPVALGAFFVFLSALRPERSLPALATCVLAMSFIFIDNAGFARPDLMCCALGLCGLAAYMRLRERSLVRALFWSNLLIAASCLSHPNGIFHFAGLTVLALWFDRRRLTLARLLAAAAPYLILGALWGLYIMQDYPAFVDQMRINGTNGRWTGTLNPLMIVWNEIRLRYLVAFGFETRGYALLKALALIAYVAAVAGSLLDSNLRKQGETRLLLVMLGVYWVAMSIFNQKLSYYLIHILPWYVALLAGWCRWLWIGRPRLRPVVAAVVLLLCAVDSGGILLKARDRSYVVREREALDFLRKNAAPSARIVGSAALIYGLEFNPNLRDDPYLGLKGGLRPDAVVIEQLYRGYYAGWAEERPVDVRAIRARLAEYRLAYRSPDYEVYLGPAH